MDSIHCYIYHLYDIGLRVKNNDNQQQSKSVLNSFSARILSKFNINNKQESETFMDGMCQCMLDDGITSNEIQRVIETLQFEEYDTDAFLDDIRVGSKSVNISNIVNEH